MFLSQSQSHLYAGAGTNGKITFVLLIQQLKCPMQLSGKGYVSPNLHTGGTRALEGHKMSGWEDHLEDLPFLFSLPISRASAEDLILYRDFPESLSVLPQTPPSGSRAWGAAAGDAHHPSLTTSFCPTISTCVFTMTENKKILPPPPKILPLLYSCQPQT